MPAARSRDLAPLAVELLIALHAHKTLGYGDAWRKRGELLSIFTNLARKYDRLVVALDRGVRSHDESLLDTTGDLCVYAAKYLTWLAEQHPGSFDAVTRGATSAQCADDGGPDALAHVLRALDVGKVGNVAGAWSRLKPVFGSLEAGLIAQAERREGDSPLSLEHKVELAWAIAAAAAALLVALANDEHDAWRVWRDGIEALG